MSIASQIEDYADGLTAAYNMVSQRGGTIPARKNMQNLSTAIATIPSGSGEDWGTVTYLNSSNQPTTATIRNQYEYQSLSSNNASTSAWSATIDGLTIPAEKITGVSLGSSAKVLPDYFLHRCPNDVSFSATSLITIGIFCLAQSGVNTSPTLPNTLTTIGDSFFSGCASYNKPLVVPDSVVSIGKGFLSASKVFNSTLTLSSSLVSIGDTFLSQSTVFNQPIVFPSTLTTIGEQFMTQAKKFNQSIYMSGVTTVGRGFLSSSPVFNSNVDLPNVTTIGTQFLQSCAVFNSTISIPRATSIGGQFLMACKKYNKDIAIFGKPGSNFMGACDAMVSKVYAGTDQTPTSDHDLATTNSSAPMYTTGVTIVGPYRAEWLAALPNRTSSPYRKLIDGGAS